MPTFMFCGEMDPAILGGGKQSQTAYDAMPASTPKMLYEMAGQGHFAWGTPMTTDNNLGRYALAWQKFSLEGDERYGFILRKQGAAASEWRSNFQ